MTRHSSSMPAPAPTQAKAMSRGFTLVELLVGLTLGLVVLTGLGLLLQNNSQHQRELEKSLRVMENARFALDSLTDDVRHAGFFGEVNPSALTVGIRNLDPCGTALEARLGWDLGEIRVPPNGTSTVPAPIFSTTGVSHACLTQASTSQTQVLTLARTDHEAATARTAGNLYLQLSRCATDVPVGFVVEGNGALSTDVRTVDCLSTFGVTRRLTKINYYLSPCNECSPSDQIPTLKRAEYINGAYQIQSVAEDIERWALAFGLDDNADATVDRWVGAAAIDGTGTALWANVIAVRITVLAKAAVATPSHRDVVSYNMEGTPYTPNDDFKRVYLTQTVRLLNAGGRLER